MKCNKCFEEHQLVELAKYAYYPYPTPPKPDDPPRMIEREDYFLCPRCNNIFSNQMALLKEFLKDDCGAFPMHKADRSMIEARRKRNMQEKKDG